MKETVGGYEAAVLISQIFIPYGSAYDPSSEGETIRFTSSTWQISMEWITEFEDVRQICLKVNRTGGLPGRPLTHIHLDSEVNVAELAILIRGAMRMLDEAGAQ